MSPAQPRLFPDAQPLVERLGRWWRGRQGDWLSIPGDGQVFLQLLEDVAAGRNPLPKATVSEQQALAEDLEQVGRLRVSGGKSEISGPGQVGS